MSWLFLSNHRAPCFLKVSGGYGMNFHDRRFDYDIAKKALEDLLPSIVVDRSEATKIYLSGLAYVREMPHYRRVEIRMASFELIYNPLLNYDIFIGTND